MAGTIEGGRKAAAKNLAQNPNFYRDIGRIGGKNGHTGGFAANPELARIAGAKGGRISRRGKSGLTYEERRRKEYGNVRTSREILKRIHERKKLDVMGFEWPFYIDGLGYDEALEFHKGQETEESWERHYLGDDDRIRYEMTDYLEFAWEKANNKRGLSAQRSIGHYLAWSWLLNDDLHARIVAEFESNYQHYGKEILIMIGDHLGVDSKQWDDGVREND